MASVGREPDGKAKQIMGAITGPSESLSNPMNAITSAKPTPHSGAEDPAITNAITSSKKG